MFYFYDIFGRAPVNTNGKCKFVQKYGILLKNPAKFQLNFASEKSAAISNGLQ